MRLTTQYAQGPELDSTVALKLVTRPELLRLVKRGTKQVPTKHFPSPPDLQVVRTDIVGHRTHGPITHGADLGAWHQKRD